MTTLVLPSRRSLLLRSVSRPALAGVVAGALAATISSTASPVRSRRSR